MKGGFYRPKGRNAYRVWFSFKGHKLFINRYLDGSPLYHPGQAERVLEKIRSEVDQGIFDPSLWGKDKAIQFQNAWKLYQEQRPCGPSRTQGREQIYNDFLLPYFKDKSLKEIEEHHIMDWWSTIPKTYAPNYLKVILATLRAFFKFHRVTRMKMFEFPVIKVPHKTPAWLSKTEQNKILGSIPSHHYPIFRFLQFYGCRVSEACNLRRSDVDWEKNIITFRERKNDKENTLPLFDEVKGILKSGKLTHWEYVFCTMAGERYSRQVLYQVWASACKKSGAEVIPLKNATRHSLACQLLQAGETGITVARVLGNSPAMIEKHYGSISIERVKEVLKSNLSK